MNRIAHALSLLVVVWILATCCKDKTPSTPSYCTTCQSVTEVKKFFCFKQGSWWVYEEETSHIRDSIYVYYYWNDTTSYDFYVGAESALTGYRFRKWPTYLQGVQGCSPTNPVNKKCILITGDKGKFQDFVSENYVFFMKYSVGDSLGSYNNQYPNNFFKIADIKSSYQLGSYTFGETVKVFDPHARQENDNPTNYYYSKGVGLVRKELLDSNEVWNLVNYYIIP